MVVLETFILSVRPGPMTIYTTVRRYERGVMKRAVEVTENRVMQEEHEIARSTLGSRIAGGRDGAPRAEATHITTELCQSRTPYRINVPNLQHTQRPSDGGPHEGPTQTGEDGGDQE